MYFEIIFKFYPAGGNETLERQFFWAEENAREFYKMVLKCEDTIFMGINVISFDGTKRDVTEEMYESIRDEIIREENEFYSQEEE